MFAWLDRLSDEGHSSEQLAQRFHWAHVGFYAILLAGYTCMIGFHASAALRHRRAANLLKSARRDRSGATDGGDA